MSLSYKELKALQIGDIRYESSQYGNIKFTVKTLPVEKYSEGLKSNQLEWTASVKGEEDIEYLMTETLMHYGAGIYMSPAYVGVPNRG